MDEQRLAELFRAAAGEAPPPSFGSDEVIAASRRVTARRRSALAGGTLLGVAVLAGGALTAGQLLPQAPGGAEGTPRAGAGAPAEARPFAAPGPAPAVPEARSLPGAGVLVNCGPVDRQLADRVTPLLAERHIEQAGAATQVPEPCPQGSRSVAVPVTGGTLYVLIVPSAGQPEPVRIDRADGGRGQAVMLDDGRGLAVISVPAEPGRAAPYSGQLADLAGALASRV